jgi:hypothetical protein
MLGLNDFIAALPQRKAHHLPHGNRIIDDQYFSQAAIPPEDLVLRSLLCNQNNSTSP